MDNLLEKAQERILEMNQLMSRIEEIEQKMAGVVDAELVFHTPGAGTTKITGLVTEEAIERIIKHVHGEINTAKSGYTQKLMELMGLGHNGTIRETVIGSGDTKTKKARLDYETVRSMYADKCLDMKEIAAHYGCTVSVISRFMKMNNITARPRGGNMRANRTVAPIQKPVPVPVRPELTQETVRKLYTDGPASLAEAAKHFGVGNGELHAFIEKYGLKKVSGKDKIFQDAGKARP